MADFTVDVGFDSRKIRADILEVRKIIAMENSMGGTSTGAGRDKASESIGLGFMKAIRSLGIITLLMSIQTVTDLLAFLMGMINGAIGLLLGFFINYIVPFFKDPLRVFLQLGLFIVNGIISALESFANLLLPGNPVELPRFQSDLVLEAYDKMKEEIKNAGADTAKIKQATKDFTSNFANSFMKKEEYEKIKTMSIQNNTSMLETLNFIKGDTESLGSFVSDASNLAKNAANSAMKTVSDLMDYIKNKANAAMGKSSGSMSGVGTSFSTNNMMSIIPLSQKDQKAKDAWSKYNVNLGFKAPSTSFGGINNTVLSTAYDYAGLK